MKFNLNKLKKSKAGVTLLELVVVMAIMGILGVGVMSLLSSTSNIYQKENTLINQRELASTICADIEVQVRKAKCIYISTEANLPTPLPSQIETLSGGKKLYCAESALLPGKTVLYYGAEEYYGTDTASVKALYGKNNVSISFKADKSADTLSVYDLLIVTLTVSDDNGNTYSTSTVPILLNISAETGIYTNSHFATGSSTIDGIYLFYI